MSKDIDEKPAALLTPEGYHVKDAASSHYEEKTEIIYGERNVTNFALQRLSNVFKTLDLCGDRFGSSIIVANEPIMQKYIELHNRGVKQRHITEITPENISDCKKLMKFQELRHLDGLKGYLSILDGRVLGSHAYGQDGRLPHAVASTVRIFVEQQQYFFETLWNKALPARQRIREIEQGVKREFVETIRDPSEIQKIGFDLIKKGEEEILLLLSTTSTSFLKGKADGKGALDLIREAATSSPPHNVKIRILVIYADDDLNRFITEAEEMVKQLKKSRIEVRRINQRQGNFLHKNNLMLLIADQSSCLTVESDDKNETSHEEDIIELATYSNSDTTVFAYTSIFENLWMRTEV